MRKSLSSSTKKYSQTPLPTQQRRQLKRTSSLRNHNQSALSNLWELPQDIVTNIPSRVQSIISLNVPKESTSDGRARFIRYPKRLAERCATTSAALTGSIAYKQPQNQVVIESSDSSQEIECLTEPATSQQRPRRPVAAAPVDPKPGSQTEPPRKRRVQNMPSVVESVEVDGSDDDDFVEEISQIPNVAALPRMPVTSAKRDIPIDLDSSFGDDSQIEFVSVKTPSKPPRLTPSKEQPCLPSSPPLLRANSPTIRRFNSNGLQLVVLAAETQSTDQEDMESDVAAEVFSGKTLTSACMPDTSFFFSGRALSASTLVYSNSADSGQANVHCQYPNALPHTKGHATKQLHSSINDNDAELSSDPISEFLSPAAPTTPKSSLAAPDFSELSTMSVPLTSMSASKDTRNNLRQDASIDEDDRSITQWYKDNLFTQRLDDDDDNDGDENNGNEEDEDPLSSILNNGILDSDSNGETDKGENILQPNRDRTTSNNSRDCGDGDDGYSSPLEGFWDLRCSTQGSMLERNMYMNQFEPSQRPSTARKRKSSQRDIAPADFNNEHVTPKGRSGTGPKCNTAPAGLRGKVAIRPLVSSRPPRPAANRPAATKPPANLPGYNHYADDPYLDMAGSMGWEGSGLSRFG